MYLCWASEYSSIKMTRTILERLKLSPKVITAQVFFLFSVHSGFDFLCDKGLGYGTTKNLGDNNAKKIDS